MSQAEDLLSTLSETAHEHNHSVAGSDIYFVIDPITREISSTLRNKNIIMQRDHESKRYIFKLPRYVEGHDMSLCTAVKVHYNNIDGTTGQEYADVADMYDLRVDTDEEDMVVSSWVIRRQATQMAGILSFLVQYLCVADDGETITYEWHTDIYSDVEVKPGRNNGQQAIIEYTDILEQWRARLFGAGDSVISNIENVAAEQQASIIEEGEKQVSAAKSEGEAQIAAIALKGAETLATIPEDYTATYNMAEEAYRNKADAIVVNTSGESIAVNDASNNHLQDLKIYGRTEQNSTNGYQLCKISSSTFGTGTSILDASTNSITATFTDHYYAEVFYARSEVIDKIMSSIGKTLYMDCEATYDSDMYSSIILYGTFSDGTTYVEKASLLGTTFCKVDIPETLTELKYISLRFARKQVAYSVSDFIVNNIMLYFDGDGTWEPYTGCKASPNPDYPQELVSIENPTAYIYGENMLNLDEGLNSQFVKNDDGTYTIHRTNAYRFSEFMEMHVPANVTITGKIHGARDDDYSFLYIQFMSADNEHSKAMALSLETDTRTITCDYPIAKARIYMPPAAVDGDSKTFTAIQVQIGTDATTYKAYEPVQSMTFPHTLRAIPATSGGNYTDTNGQQWVADYVDCENKQLVQRVKTLLLTGNENWKVYTDRYIYLTLNDLAVKGAKGYCSHFPYKYSYELYGIFAVDNVLYLGQQLSAEFDVDASTWISFLNENPVTIDYVLAEPIITPLTDEEVTVYKALRTNRVNTTITNDCDAYMEVTYAADTETYINNNYVSKSVMDDVLKRLAVLEAK